MGVLFDAAESGCRSEGEPRTLRASKGRREAPRAPIPLYPERGQLARAGWVKTRRSYARRTVQKPLRFLQSPAVRRCEHLRGGDRPSAMRMRRQNPAAYLLVW